MRRWRSATAPTIFRCCKPPALASPIAPSPRSPLERTRVWSTLISPRCSTRRVLRARISSRGEPLSRYHRHHGRDTHESQSGDGHGDLWPCSIHTSGPHSARLLLDVSLSSVLTVGLVFNAPREGARNEGRSAMTIASVMKAPEANDHAALAETIPLDEIDVSNPALYQQDVWQPYFRRLRREAPVHYCRTSPVGPYWSVTKHKDITALEVDHKRFSSSSAFGGITLA